MGENIEKKESAPIQLRLATAEDLGFLFNSWLKSFRDGEAVKSINNTVYFRWQHALIETLLSRSTVLVAVDNKDSTQIFGYIVAENIDGLTIIHYLYVKQPFRSLNIGRQLVLAVHPELAKTAFVFTHQTKASKSLYSRFLGMYNPYLLYQFGAK